MGKAARRKRERREQLGGATGTTADIVKLAMEIEEGTPQSLLAGCDLLAVCSGKYAPHRPFAELPRSSYRVLTAALGVSAPGGDHESAAGLLAMVDTWRKTRLVLEIDEAVAAELVKWSTADLFLDPELALKLPALSMWVRMPEAFSSDWSCVNITSAWDESEGSALQIWLVNREGSLASYIPLGRTLAEACEDWGEEYELVTPREKELFGCVLALAVYLADNDVDFYNVLTHARVSAVHRRAPHAAPPLVLAAGYATGELIRHSSSRHGESPGGTHRSPPPTRGRATCAECGSSAETPRGTSSVGATASTVSIGIMRRASCTDASSMPISVSSSPPSSASGMTSWQRPPRAPSPDSRPRRSRRCETTLR